MSKVDYIARDAYTATILSLVIYNVESTINWSKKNTYFTDGDLITKSIFLERNLIGKEGLLDIGYYIYGDTLFFVYSGTEDAELWLYNIDTDSKSCNGFNFHDGFLKLAKEISLSLTKDNFINNLIKDNDILRVVHCGHSAGGAVAGIMPILISEGVTDQLVIDFGTPRYLADNSLEKYPFFRLRFQEVYDIIPCVPLTWRGPLHGFHHFGEVKYFNKKGYLKKLPWYRPVFFIWKYLKSLYFRGPVKEALAHHSMGNYSSVIISNSL